MRPRTSASTLASASLSGNANSIPAARLWPPPPNLAASSAASIRSRLRMLTLVTRGPASLKRMASSWSRSVLSWSIALSAWSVVDTPGFGPGVNELAGGGGLREHQVQGGQAGVGNLMIDVGPHPRLGHHRLIGTGTGGVAGIEDEDRGSPRRRLPVDPLDA